MNQTTESFLYLNVYVNARPDARVGSGIGATVGDNESRCVGFDVVSCSAC
jgi:hypothetical protein